MQSKNPYIPPAPERRPRKIPETGGSGREEAVPEFIHIAGVIESLRPQWGFPRRSRTDDHHHHRKGTR